MAGTAALGVILFVKESRTPSAPGAPQAHRLEALNQADAHPILSRVLLVTLISTAAFAGMESVFGLYADTRFGWTASQVAACFALIGVIASIGQGVLTGRLARRFGEARVLTAGLSIIGTSLLVTPFISRPALAVVAVACTAFGQSLVFPCVGALISRATPPDRQGQMLGLNMAAGSLARIGGPLLAGPVFGIAIGGPYWVGAALMVPAIGFALVIVRRTKTAA
jgi:predicted MFS family arabinose efflux permease